MSRISHSDPTMYEKIELVGKCIKNVGYGDFAIEVAKKQTPWRFGTPEEFTKGQEEDLNQESEIYIA